MRRIWHCWYEGMLSHLENVYWESDALCDMFLVLWGYKALLLTD